MNEHKPHSRYTILNSYMGGSNLLPQSLHALNELNSRDRKNEFNEIQKKKLYQWSDKYKTEIVLSGMNHKELEDLNILFEQRELKLHPFAKFNESIESANGICASFTFIADWKILIGVKFIRDNRIPPSNIEMEIRNNKIENMSYDEFEAKLIRLIANLPLAK